MIQFICIAPLHLNIGKGTNEHFNAVSLIQSRNVTKFCAQIRLTAIFKLLQLEKISDKVALWILTYNLVILTSFVIMYRKK